MQLKQMGPLDMNTNKNIRSLKGEDEELRGGIANLAEIGKRVQPLGRVSESAFILISVIRKSRQEKCGQTM